MRRDKPQANGVVRWTTHAESKSAALDGWSCVVKRAAYNTYWSADYFQPSADLPILTEIIRRPLDHEPQVIAECGDRLRKLRRDLGGVPKRPGPIGPAKVHLAGDTFGISACGRKVGGSSLLYRDGAEVAVSCLLCRRSL